MIEDDPTIARIRDARRRISEMCDNDPDKLVAFYREVQKQYQSQIVKAPSRHESAEDEAFQEDFVEVG